MKTINRNERPLLVMIIIVMVLILLLISCRLSNKEQITLVNESTNVVYTVERKNIVQTSTDINKTVNIPLDKSSNTGFDELHGKILVGCPMNIFIEDFEIRKSTYLLEDEHLSLSDIGSNSDEIIFINSTEILEENNLAEKLPDIYKVAIDGSNLQRITNDNYFDYSIDVQEKNSSIIYSTDTEFDSDAKSRYKLKVLDVNTGASEIIYEGEFDQYGKWSPNGSQIVIYSFNPDYFSGGSISIYDSITKETKKIPVDEKYEIFEPDWSPDQKNISIILEGESENYLGLINPSSGKLVDKFQFQEKIALYTWSPDGNHIIVETTNTSNLIDEGSKLWLLNKNTSDIKLIHEGSINSLSDHFHAKWSPDGKYILFIINTNSKERKSVIIMNPFNVQQIYSDNIICTHVENTIWIGD
jgi:dipeptidyl aminopeptidase/acylaminoacyl peptidase